MAPPRLAPGDEIRIVTPARSLAVTSDTVRDIAYSRLTGLGLHVSFGQNANEIDESRSSPVQSRIHDLHEAFADKSVKAVLAAEGGYNTNQILSYVDYQLIRRNPKVFCGFSDITALNDAILAKAGLMTYYGPVYSSFGERDHFEYSLEHFRKCVFDSAPVTVRPSENWSNDRWRADQDARALITNEGYWPIHEGEARGTIVGGNLDTLNLLQGTEFMPRLDGAILFVEDDSATSLPILDRNLQSIFHLPDFRRVKALIMGRFEKASNIAREDLERLVRAKKELGAIPVVANVDFGHSEPRITFPIGGTASLSVTKKETTLVILKH
ncbi:MAG: LD-carboxypeptidase [Candidatus Hydrogenedentes bacterium]|nr:LD-carboxypeptidase [Candidatus Hydrogenedentota bacterium]